MHVGQVRHKQNAAFATWTGAHGMKQKESKTCNSDYAWQAQTQVHLWSIQWSHASNCRKWQQDCTAGVVDVEGGLTDREAGRQADPEGLLVCAHQLLPHEEDGCHIQSICYKLVDDHENDGDITCGRDWHHTVHIACRPAKSMSHAGVYTIAQLTNANSAQYTCSSTATCAMLQELWPNSN